MSKLIIHKKDKPSLNISLDIHKSHFTTTNNTHNNHHKSLNHNLNTNKFNHKTIHSPQHNQTNNIQQQNSRTNNYFNNNIQSNNITNLLTSNINYHQNDHHHHHQSHYSTHQKIYTKKKLSTDLNINHQNYNFTPSNNHITNKKIVQSKSPFFAPTDQFYTSKFKRKLSLSKTWKINSSVNVDSHLLAQKYQKANKLIKKHKYHQAIDLLETILPFHQSSQEIKQMYFWLAISYNKIGNLNEAIKTLTLIIQTFPDFQDAYLYRATIYSKINKFKQATLDLQFLIKINPKNIYSYIQLGNYEQKKGNLSKALQIWEYGRVKCENNIELTKLIIQSKIKLKKFQQVEKELKQLSQQVSKNSSDLHYLKGLYEKERNQLTQACIFFEQAIKYNNSKKSVSQSLYNLLKIRIIQRDFYAAFHASNRMQFLDIKDTNLLFYKTFLQSVILIMKKKFQEAVQILYSDIQKKQFSNLDKFLSPLYFKFLGYAQFKLGKHEEVIKAYFNLKQNYRTSLDQVSKYNLCLAEGIIAVQKSKNFELGYRKFTQAKSIFSYKVQPYIYVCMTMLKQNLDISNTPEQKQKIIQKALDQLNKAQKINPSNSNLLFHRTLLHLSLQNWDLAHNDINKCIQKAQQNLPKYFYIRGLCYGCIKDFPKAINQYSIAISLDNSYYLAYLQRAKSEFLLGQSESGFKDLKQYMQLHPQDLRVHKWIGDLLYQGKSYNDAVRAYSQLNQKKYFQLFQMRAKCYFRLGKLEQVKSCLRNMQKIPIPHSYNKKDHLVEVDFIALNLLSSLLKNDFEGTLNNHIKLLNKYLQDNKTGFLFQLIDCMNLLGVAAFYMGKYQQAYQSFILVLELYQTFSQKQALDLKSQASQQQLNIQLDKIIFNMFLCQVLQGSQQKALNLFEDEQIISSCSKYQFGKQFKTIVKMAKKKQQNVMILQPNISDSLFKKLKPVQLNLGNLKIKTRLFFGLYHQSPQDLFSIGLAKSIVDSLHPSYIDNMPQGPWIKRNQYGVIFTQNMIQTDHSLCFDSSKHTTNRNQHKDYDQEYLQQSSKRNQLNMGEMYLSQKQYFKKMMKLDKSISDKINRFIKKQAKNQ